MLRTAHGSSPILAQGKADKAVAESLFAEGQRLMAENKIDEACNKFAASMRAERSVGALLNLARCHERQGKIAAAWAEYKEAAGLAAGEGDEHRAAAARDIAKALEPKLSRLTIRAPEPTAGMTVTRNGTVVDPGAFEVALPIDPGQYRIEASAAGHVAWSSTVTIGGDAERKIVVVPRLKPESVAVPPPSSQPETPASADTGSDAGSGQRIAGFVIGGVGIVVEVIDSAKTTALGADIAIGVGAAALVAGVVLLLTAGGEQAGGEAAVRVLPSISATGSGSLVLGAF